MAVRVEKTLLHYLKELQRKQEEEGDARYRERAIGAIEMMYQAHLIPRSDYYLLMRKYGVE